MTSLEKLASLFERFPGIGPRQARRFVYHLLKQNENDVKILSEFISSIQDTVTECNGCFRFFSKKFWISSRHSASNIPLVMVKW